jgi:hypothetical protein
MWWQNPKIVSFLELQIQIQEKPFPKCSAFGFQKHGF